MLFVKVMTNGFKYKIDPDLQYFKDYFQEIEYGDQFGHDSLWNREINLWLKYSHQIDQSFYERGKQKVKQEGKRDPFLAEILTIFYFGTFLGARDLSLEPRRNTKRDIDFSCKVFDGDTWFVEVKNSGWKSEKIKDPNRPTRKELERINMPKYRTGDGGSFSPVEETVKTLDFPIKNSLAKFRNSERNAVVIIPDRILPLREIISDEVLELEVRNFVSSVDKRGLISRVVILEVCNRNANDQWVLDYWYRCINMSKC